MVGKGGASPFRCPMPGTALADPRAVFYFQAADPWLSRPVYAPTSSVPAASSALSRLPVAAPSFH